MIRFPRMVLSSLLHCWHWKSSCWHNLNPSLKMKLKCTTSSRCMGLLPDTQNSGLRMRRECRESFPRHRFQSKLLVSDPDRHHGTCVTHVPWCMSGSLNSGGGETFPAFPAHAQLAILRIWQEAHGLIVVYHHYQSHSKFVVVWYRLNFLISPMITLPVPRQWCDCPEPVKQPWR